MTSLKKIYVAAHAVDAHMLEGLLEQEGIQAMVRGDDFVPLQGGSLFEMEVRPSVWVFDDEHLLRARELADDFGHRLTPRGPTTGDLDLPLRRDDRGAVHRVLELREVEVQGIGRPGSHGDRRQERAGRHRRRR